MKTISPEKFRNPPKEYTLAPFWFWNDSLEEDSIAFQLEEMYKKGVYECIIHARKGLEVEYLSDKWFDRIRFAAAYARKKGMKLWIYDEDNWPSGYAGGRVIADNADFAATCLSVEKIYPVMYEDITVEDVPGKELVAVVAVHKNEEFFDITDHENHCCKPWHSETLQWEVFVFRMEKCRHKPCYINSPYIDMLNPAATTALSAIRTRSTSGACPSSGAVPSAAFLRMNPAFIRIMRSRQKISIRSSGRGIFPKGSAKGSATISFCRCLQSGKRRGISPHASVGAIMPR